MKKIEEAEEIAALNLAKFRQTQTNLADAEERADLNDQAFAKVKAKGRASVGPLVSLHDISHSFMTKKIIFFKLHGHRSSKIIKINFYFLVRRNNERYWVELRS